MDVTAAGAMSIAMNQSQLMQAVNISVMKKVMDLQETQVASLVEDLQQVAPPPSGHQLDFIV